MSPSTRHLVHSWGRTPTETLGLNYWDITPQEEYKDQEAKQLKKLHTPEGRYGPYYKHYIHKDGHHVPVRLMGHRLTYDNKEYIWSLVENLENERYWSGSSGGRRGPCS